mmetsp:Transcript_7806/g.11732  ORF Transcript_7806/g.11732 Transcript_7806/m.11732 type:complete len:367 (-) Transcript_7806:909-2009(-)
MKMRLSSKMFKAPSGNFLIQFQPNDEFKGRIFERFMQEHGISSSYEKHPLDTIFGEEPCRLMNCIFMIVGTVRIANLYGIIQVHAGIPIQWVIQEVNLLVLTLEGINFIKSSIVKNTELGIDITSLVGIVFLIGSFVSFIEVRVSVEINSTGSINDTGMVSRFGFIPLKCDLDSQFHAVHVFHHLIPFMIRNIFMLFTISEEFLLVDNVLEFLVDCSNVLIIRFPINPFGKNIELVPIIIIIRSSISISNSNTLIIFGILIRNIHSKSKVQIIENPRLRKLFNKPIIPKNFRSTICLHPRRTILTHVITSINLFTGLDISTSLYPDRFPTVNPSLIRFSIEPMSIAMGHHIIDWNEDIIPCPLNDE